MSRDFRMRILMIVLILAFLSVVFVMLQGNLFFRPFEDFKGPDYIPQGYTNTENHSSDNERIFEFKGNGTFYVGVIKNSYSTQLHELINPFEEDPESVIKTNQSLIINNHNVNLNISEKHLKIHGQNFKDFNSLSNNVTMPNVTIPGVDLNMSKFQVFWRCEETDLSYVAMGMVTTDKLDEMKHMIESIKCHEKEEWNFFGFKIPKKWF